MNTNKELDLILSAKPFQLDSSFVAGKDIVLYGAGRLGDMAVNIFKKNKVEIAYFIDENHEQKNELNGYPIYSIDKLKEADPKTTVVLVSAFKVPFHQLKTLIGKYSSAEVFTVYDLMYFIDGAFFSNGWYSGPVTNFDREKISKVFNSLSDDLSKKVYLNFLNWRIKRTETIDSDITCEEDKYHNGLTEPIFSEPGVIIDAGAFDLSFSIKSFSKGYPISRCIAFEPDVESYACCQTLISSNSHNTQHITLEPNAIGAQIDEVCFVHGHGLASRLVFDNLALPTVKVTTITDYVQQHCINDRINVIKIHIEGAELESLLGGKEIIEEHRPLLMINCSHNRDGLWAIQEFCLNLKDYNYFMRSHAFYGEGLTFYAVPVR